MTKARDLAGFASSSVTTTASDGLVLKGDGSSTDVVIKNGANATVATVADGTTNLAVVGAVTGALAQGAIQVGNSSGVAAPLTKGAANTFLTSDGTDLAWGTVSTATPTVVFPSNWASPTSTYNSSGTWSKGSLADDDYVWFYLLNSGGGGGITAEARGGFGGRAMLIYGTAGVLNGATYVVAAEKAGQTSGVSGTVQNASSLTLTSGNGSIAFTPINITQADDVSGSSSRNLNLTVATAGTAGTYINAFLAKTYSIQTGTLPSGYGQWTTANTANGYFGDDLDCVFGGGVGEYLWNGGYPKGVSLFSGDGGADDVNSGAGVFPGGGGSGVNGANGGTGAAGQIRVYHV